MPELTRRSALVLGGALGLAALAIPAGAASATLLGGQQPPAIPLRSVFGKVRGSTVMATGGTRSHRLTLVDILDLGPGPVDPQRCFNLIFQTQGSTPLAEGVYRLSSSRLPATSLLLSPIGRRGGGQLQAVVNRSV